MASHPVDVHVGKRLRFRRTMLGLSQEAIASGIGVTFQQIQKYERGINRMGASRLFDFANMLNVSVSYFFEGLGKETTYAEALADEARAAEPKNVLKDMFSDVKLESRETLELIRAYYRIGNPIARRKFIDLMRSFADSNEAVAQTETADAY